MSITPEQALMLERAVSYWTGLWTLPIAVAIIIVTLILYFKIRFKMKFGEYP